MRLWHRPTSQGTVVEFERVGLHAIGHIDRTIYHGAYPEGMAIRFEAFEVWGR